METFRVLVHALKPNTSFGQLSLLVIFGVALSGAFFRLDKTYQRYINEPYRLTVCWNHFKEFEISNLHSSSFSLGKRIQLGTDYYKCLKDARAVIIVQSVFESSPTSLCTFIRAIFKMQDPEASIDQATLLTFQEERQWLRSYSDQLQNFSSNLSIPGRDMFPTYQMRSNLEENSLIRSLKNEIESLKEELKSKQARLEDLSLKVINEEVFQDSWKKLLEKETESSRLTISQQDMLIKQLQEKINQLTQEEKNEEHENQVDCLNTKIGLITKEFMGLQTVLTEKDKEIAQLHEKIDLVEADKCKALNLFSMKEQRIREEIESSYSYVDLKQQVDYYSKKMKEYQNMYLEQKSYEDRILQVLSRNRELEALTERQSHELSQALTAFTQLKQDYELITIKHKSLSQLNATLSTSLEKEMKTSQLLSLEKCLLQSQVSGFLKCTSSGVFSFSSAEDLIIQNTRINSKLSENESIISELRAKNIELTRRLETFEHPKDVPFIENEEIPELPNTYTASREDFIQNLVIQNSRLQEENQYLSQRNRLGQLKEQELAKNIEELQENVRDLQQKLENYQIIDFSRIDHEKYEREIKELEGNLRVNQGIIEDLKNSSKKIKKNFEEVDGRLQEKEYLQVCSLVQWKNTQDELIRKIEALEVDGFNLRKQLKDLELRAEGQNSASLIEMELIRSRNQKLEADYQDLERKTIINEISLQESVNQLKKELQDEKMKRNEKEFLIDSMEKITYLVYKALKRPNDFEDARG